MNQASIAALVFAVVALIAALFLSIVVCRTTIPWRFFNADDLERDTLLITLWLGGHILFAISMLFAGFMKTIGQGTTLIACIGISWALTNSVPFAILGKEVAQSSQAGTLTSLHNAAISSPQVLAALVCTLLFLAAQYVGRRDDVVAAMWIAGFAAGAAAWKTMKLRSIFLY